MSSRFAALLELVESRPASWNAWTQQTDAAEVAARLGDARALMEQLARWYGYALHRREHRHSVGVSRSNRLATAVRKALGEPFPKEGEVVF
jgi:hypothetical protein